MNDRRDLVDKIFAELPAPMQEQGIKTNKFFLKMTELERQQEDLNERLEIARLEWKREDKLWRRMVIDCPPKPDLSNPAQSGEGDEK